MAKSTSNLFEEEENNTNKKEVVKKEVVSEDVVKDEVATEDVQDIDLTSIQKKRFRINGDNDKILELNTSDLNIVARLGESYPKLNKFMDEVQSKLDELPDASTIENEEDFKKFSDLLKELDNKMRTEVDYIFDAPVSEVCASDGNMWDPIDGAFRYEHILEKLSKLYENNFNEEFARMKAKVNMKTQKYTNKGKKK